MLEEGDEDTMESDDDNLANTGEYEKTIAFIDGKIRKFEKAANERSTSSQKTDECEMFGNVRIEIIVI